MEKKVEATGVWKEITSSASWAQPEDFWDTIKRWVVQPFYRQIHKIEILSAKSTIVRRRSSDVSTDSAASETIQVEYAAEELPNLNLYDIERNAALDPTTQSAHFIIHRKLFPKDYTRKIEIEDITSLDLLNHRAEFAPQFPDPSNPDPTWLPHYYVHALKFALQLSLFHPIDYEAEPARTQLIEEQPLTDKGTPLPKKDDELPAESSRSASPPRPTGRMSFECMLFPDPKHQDVSKLTRIGNVNIKTMEKWSKKHREGGYVKRVNHDVVVPRDAYTAHYRRLKEKYMFWVEKWEESTDPQKFVYEDVGIAAFLIAMWETEREELCKQFPDRYDANYRQSFVDLGAGNGFLVYILTSEGYNGYGIDIQKRKIWDKFPPNVRNIEEAIMPEMVKYEGIDWILANHSDELTPWVPFIAARTNSRFWVLPCCEWNFDKRFTAKRKNLSRYQTYLEYVKEITQACGYKAEVEPMRIPSTRNVSIVGRVRSIDVNDPADLDRIAENQQQLLKKARFKTFEPRARDQKSSHQACDKCLDGQSHESHESHDPERESDMEEEESSASVVASSDEPSSKRLKLE